MATAWQQHEARWSNYRACALCEGRGRIVLGRGEVPADVLLVGEAPGESENVIGLPFVGPAGKLLDIILAKTIPPGVSYCLGNLVACIPRDDYGAKTAEPDEEYIRKCGPRLQGLIDICNPRLVVAVGALARDYLDPKLYPKLVRLPAGAKQVDVQHPASILRLNLAMRGLAVQRCIVTIKNAVESL